MTDLPSVKTHPIIVPIIAVAFWLAFGVACAIGGYWIRVQLESRAELAVVVDDGNFMRELEVKAQQWTEEFLKSDEDFHNGYKVPDCLANPMPPRYHDDDAWMRGDREQEE